MTLQSFELVVIHCGYFRITLPYIFDRLNSMSVSFWNFLDKRVKGDEKNIPWFVNDKLKANSFYKENNIPTPEILSVYKSTSEIDFNTLPESFCIKPSVMHSACGVLPVTKVGENKYYDKLRKRIISTDGIIHELNLAYEKCEFKGSYRIIVEQALSMDGHKNLIPFDYKLYTFGKGLGLVVQVDRNSGRNYVGFLDHNFEPICYSKVVKKQTNNIYQYSTAIKPKFADQMKEQALKIIELLDTPFLSVDIYADQTGFYVGEITPAPGGPYYKSMFELLPDVDQRLGGMWAECSL